MTANGYKTEDELRRNLVKFGKWLYRLGFMPGSSGNLSVRVNPECVLATPTGCSKYLLKPEDMVLVDMEGRQLGGSRKVTSEIGIHLAVYSARKDINAVVHAHPPLATGFACAGRALDQPLCAEAIMMLGPVAAGTVCDDRNQGSCREPCSADSGSLRHPDGEPWRSRVRQQPSGCFSKDGDRGALRAYLPCSASARICLPAGRACSGATAPGSSEIPAKRVSRLILREGATHPVAE